MKVLMLQFISNITSSIGSSVRSEETQDVREAAELSGVRSIVGQLVAVSLATSLLPAGYRVTERASDTGGKKTPV